MKKYFTPLFAIVLSISFAFGCSDDSSNPEPSVPVPVPVAENLDPVPAAKTNPTKIYMHYMPWFETNDSSPDGQWGYHWKMNNKNPNIIGADGHRQIASHYYPLIGPYHSGDREVIENHLLMMKYSGVDGILIDWYGTYNLNDYRSNKENAEQFITMIEKVGLEYAIVYEDRFLPNIVSAGLAPTNAAAAKVDMNYMQANYFNDANYIKINNKPLLMCFGPISLQTPAQWTTAFADLTTKPTFLTLWYESADAGMNASGEYAWVYQDNAHLTSFYNTRVPSLAVSMGSAYPGFNDFYDEGGAPAGINWTISHNNGATLDATLTMAQNAHVDYLQLITWNDFGEGTMIEPTVETGYTYVQKVKAFAGVQNQTDAFPAISKLFNLRRQYKTNIAIQAKLDLAFGYFVSMQPEKAITALNEIQ